MNLYTYCHNNPILGIDPTGHFFDTLFDVVSLVVDVVEFVKEPTPMGAVNLLCDVVGLVAPGVPSAGLKAGVKAVGAAADAIKAADKVNDVRKAVEVVDDVHDAAKVVDNITDAGRALDNTTDALKASKIHGNSKASQKIQHGYEIYRKSDGDVVKTGISGSVLNKNGTSRRANSQVSKWNKVLNNDIYAARVVKTDMPKRKVALDWEIQNSVRLHREGNSMSKHVRPRPWED